MHLDEQCSETVRVPSSAQSLLSPQTGVRQQGELGC